MLLSDLLKTASEGLKRNKTRSFLTTLGIIIGVGSVILMVSIGASFQKFIVEQVEQFGGDTFEIYAKGLEGGAAVNLTITFGDYEALQRLTTVTSVAPVIFVPDTVRSDEEEIAPMVIGSTKEIIDNWALKLDRGRLLTDDDVDGARSVIVLGSEAAEDLFPTEDPLGKRVNVGARKLTVVGVLQSLGSPLGQSIDTSVFLPISLAKAMTGRSQYIDYISLKSVGSIELTKADITSVLRQRHRINNPENDPEKDDFTANSAQQALDVITSVTLGLTIFLGLIAGVSLLVGGIGIMNIMLVSVTERTKEIGLRKAVGAKKRDILLQFLLEAVVLTMIGGATGIILGASFAFVLSRIAAALLGTFPFALSLWAILLSVTMAAGTGLVFGLYPAKRASDLSPMEALRYE